ncbi:MAG: hypothetical protein WB660_30940 [Candidatus Sulfotelmatobacter sp.]
MDVSHVKAATFDSDLERSFGALPPPLVSAYPRATDGEAKQARLDLERDLRFGWGLGEVTSRNRAKQRVLLLIYSAASVPGRLLVRGLGREPLRGALVRLRPPGPGSMALERRRLESGRRNVRLLGQLREIRQSERPGPSPVASVYQHEISKLMYLGDPIIIGEVANINSLKIFDAVYTTVRGTPFAVRDRDSQGQGH